MSDSPRFKLFQGTHIPGIGEGFRFKLDPFDLPLDGRLRLGRRVSDSCVHFPALLSVELDKFESDTEVRKAHRVISPSVTSSDEYGGHVVFSIHSMRKTRVDKQGQGRMRHDIARPHAYTLDVMDD